MTEASIARSPFKDRTVGLILFGLIEMLAGLLVLLGFAFIAFLSFIGDSLPNTPSAPSAAALSSGLLVTMSALYLGLATALISLGIGSMLGRRWARSLSLVLAWMALFAGSYATVATILIWPYIKDMLEVTAAAGPEIPRAIFLLPLVLLVVFMVIVPGAFVLFYRSADVRATCELKDPKPRWTDSRPLPILALVFMLASGVLAPLYLPASGGLFMAFGLILKGATALLAALALAAISAWCAWRVWQLDLRGWWATLIFWLGIGTANVMMFDPDRQRLLYQEMGLPPEQVELVTAQAFPLKAMAPMMAISLLALLAFLLYLRQFFERRPEG
jgi:MFS family permease